MTKCMTRADAVASFPDGCCPNCGGDLDHEEGCEIIDADGAILWEGDVGWFACQNYNYCRFSVRWADDGYEAARERQRSIFQSMSED